VPPVLLGVRGEKSLRLAGACADGVILADNATSEYITWARNLVQQGRTESGRDGEGQIVVFAGSLDSDKAPESTRSEIARITEAGADAIILSPPAEVAWNDWLDQIAWMSGG
jgi:alkanesulfonate monooxygenase SsuD/methylene tetrahydromethanopterin reductase-like flavin-dependent oxidoreductase (luciferase family)